MLHLCRTKTQPQMHSETFSSCFPGKMNHVPREVAALSNTDYLCISRDTCRTNHDHVF